MADPTLKAVFYEAMERILELKATQTDLALIFLLSEFIDSVGGSQEMARIVDPLERKWERAQSEYERGEV